ncbi:MAG: AI-2E family transporter [Paludibacteraceae bacterium]|nr:AI-2E family transporter [Paludibacteraceae bacterium]
MPINDSNSTSILNRQWLVRTAITLAVLVALYLLVRRLSGVLLPFLISFVVAYMLAPIVNFFQHTCRLKSRVLSIIVTILLVIGVLTGAVAAVMPAISRQANALSQSVKTYVSQWDGSEYFSPQVNQRIEEIIQSIDIKTLIESQEIQQGIKKVLPILGDWISSGVNALMGLAVAFICILYIIFLLIDYEKITTNWHKYIPTRFRDSIVMLISDLDRNMNAYFRGQALVAGIVGILFAIGFQIIGLPMGIGIGLFIGLLNLVPYMQALGIPPCILLGLIQSAETGRPVWVVMLCIAAVFIMVQSIQDMVLVPKIMGDVTGMGPAWILLSLSVWGSLLGFVGMIIALPVTTLLVSYYKRFVLHMTDDMTKPLPRTSWNIPFLKRKTKK